MVGDGAHALQLPEHHRVAHDALERLEHGRRQLRVAGSGFVLVVGVVKVVEQPLVELDFVLRPHVRLKQLKNRLQLLRHLRVRRALLRLLLQLLRRLPIRRLRLAAVLLLARLVPRGLGHRREPGLDLLLHLPRQLRVGVGQVEEGRYHLRGEHGVLLP